MHDFFIKMIDLVHAFGYPGILFMTMIEGTFIPIPNEVTLIPAGYLVAKGSLNMFAVVICAIIGNITGSLISYWIAIKYGRSIVINYGKYLFFSESKLHRVEEFFAKHGNFSMFWGRIMPGIKHFISFPAGLGKMNLETFVIYSGLGGAIWVTFLVLLGNFIGDNEEQVNYYLSQTNNIIIVIAVVTTAFYLIYNRKK